MTRETLASLFKNVLTIAGGLFLGKSLLGTPLTTELLDGVIGAFLTVLTLIWSIKDKSVTIEMWQGVARRVLVGFGAFLIASGHLTAERLEMWIGLITTLIGVLQGVMSKQKARQLASGQIHSSQLKGARAKDIK